MRKCRATKSRLIRMKRSGLRSTKTRYRTRTLVTVSPIFSAEKRRMDTSDFARRLADKLIAQLKDRTAPWQKPWKDAQTFGPYNPTTGNRYRGVNIVALMATDFRDPRWMTYKQAQGQGWQVRGGEKATQIQHWIW